MITKTNPLDDALRPDTGQIVTWEEKLSTGIELIDSQHKELVELTNKLYQSCLSGHDDAVFKEAMSRMVNYVKFHFGAEQQLLERIHYPAYPDHKRQHDTLVKEILDAVKAAGEGKSFVANNFVRTLKEWIFGHIAFTDRQYALYVVEQKRKGLLTDAQING
jgi:hemerythrin